MLKKLLTFRIELIASLLCLTLGIASGFLGQSGDSAWYISLHKPRFIPPSWLFGPVWTVLYLMMGVALGQLWRHRQQRKFLLVLFAVQLLFNLIWSPLFFYFHRIDWALVDISLLWVSLVIFLTAALKIRTVYWLMAPYFLWVSFAWVLNFSIVTHNI